MKFKTKPYKHQLDCLEKFGHSEYFALLAEMGTGKTWIVINNIAQLFEQGEIDAVLVLAPNGVHSNWTRLEIPKHMPDSIRVRYAAWSSSAKIKERRRLIDLIKHQKWSQSLDVLNILTMNWESLQSKRAYEYAEKFCKNSKRLMIVCDESDSIKNPSAKRTKSLMKLKRHSKYRRIMTGTPINNSPFDAFSQFMFLDSKILGTTSFYAFKTDYAEMLSDSHGLVNSIKQKNNCRYTPQIVATDSKGLKKYRNLNKLSSLITPHSFRVLKKDCLDLPDKIYKTIFFDLTPDQLKWYKMAKNECRLVYEGNDTPFNKLVATMRLSQITSGYYTHELADIPVRIEGKNPKLDLLVDRVKAIINCGEQVIVWARYRVEIKDIVDALAKEKIKTVQYHGGVKKDDRVLAIDDFNSCRVRCFVGNQQAGGTGITLVSASFVIYFSNNFSLRDRLQSEDRAHRIGQTKNVTYINLAARDTVDELVISALLNKKNVADEIVDNAIKFLK